MQTKRLINLNELINAEKLRYKTFGIKLEIDVNNNFWLNNILNNRVICYGTYEEDKLIAAIYVSDSHDSLYVEYVFVDPDYQNSGLRVGRNLVKYVLDHKDEIEDYFHKYFMYSYLTPKDEKCEVLYNKMGYLGTNIMGEMVKKL